MSSRIGTVKFVDRRNCFVTLSTNLSTVYGHCLRGQKYVILSLDFGERQLLTTWHGDTTRTIGDCVELSGLFAHKLGVKDGTQVVISVARHIPTCISVLVEPVSVDDWEILELHAAYIESHLLDQTRIVWNGEVLPIWLQGNVCVFVVISEIHPHSQCTLLDVNSQVVVMPRDRYKKEIAQSSGPLRKNGVVNGHGEHNSNSDGQCNKERTEQMIECAACGLPSYDVSLLSRMTNGLRWLLTDAPYAPHLREEVVCHILGRGVQCSLRVQAFFSVVLLEPPRPRFDSKNPKSRSPPPANSPLSIQVPNETLEQLAFAQAYSVCASVDTLRHLCQVVCRPGDMFLAVLHKLWSPKEESDRKKLSVRNNSSGPSTKGDSSPLANVVEISPCVVRIVALECCSDRGLLLDGHIMAPDFLRQNLHLDVTGRVVIRTISYMHSTIRALALVIDYGGRAKLDEQVILMAFRHWLCQCSSLHCPLVVNNGMTINVPLTNSTKIPCEIHVVFEHDRSATTSPAKTENIEPQYGLICGEIMDEIPIRVTSSSKSQILKKVNTKTLNDLDPKIPSLDVKRLGGVASYLETAVRYIEFCMTIKPLAEHLMGKNVRSRALLVCGEKGVGKSAFCRLLCDNCVSLPHLAYTSVIDCKVLRGKTIESIHNCLIRAYDEAKWRQPTLLILDDLDLIAAVCASPEQELSGEAMYYARVSEVVKSMLKTIVYERSRIVVVAVSKSRKSLHPSLVASRGNHYFEETIVLERPTHEEREEILRSVMEATVLVDPQSLRNLDVPHLCKRMEGFVAKDIRRLLDRAIHANLKSSANGVVAPALFSCTSLGDTPNAHHVTARPTSQRVRLRMSDFDTALENFTTLSLRDVQLHQVEGDIGWNDVGGLSEVKKTLIETLLWPVKYPELFVNTPLRLRTGILLYGPPGSGKTLLARAVARECGLNFISIKGPELLNKYIGASEQAVRDTFARAQNAKPCVLFFDEFDSLAPRRGHDSTGVTDRVVNQFLTQLDGFEALDGVYVLAATSRPDMIDPALLRPGRLDKAIYCPMPNAEERNEILRALSKRLSLADEVCLDDVAEQTTHFTGADLRALLYNAQLLAVHRQLDLVKARRRNSRGIHEKMTRYYSQLSEEAGVSDGPPTADLFSFQEGSDIETDSDAEVLNEFLKPESKLMTISPRSSIHSDDIVSNKSTYDRSPSPISDDRLSLSSSSSRATVVTQSDLIAALESMTPSVPGQERNRYQRVYDSFRNSRRKSFSLPGDPTDNKVTLA